MDFSIVIPFYNRLEDLSACLESLTRLRYEWDRIEVILVDDGGRQQAGELVSRFADRLPISLLRQEHAGPGAARNLGANHARGKWLAFTDSDCTPAEDWLERLASALDSSADLAVGGRVVNTLSNIFSVASQWQTNYLISYFGASPGRRGFFTTNNFAVPRRSFLAAGGFDAGFRQAGGEDREFCYRWSTLGRQFRWAPDAVVYHQHRLTWTGFCRQHFHYGRGAWRYWNLRGQRSRFLQGDLRVYCDLLWKPLSIRPLPRGMAVALLQAVSQAAIAAGYCVEAWSARRV
ncbi:MAG: glycosyltransferase [Bryobacteraceae bacterium]